MSLLKKYLKECNQVYHTTFDPKGPGCVRIHLIPPKHPKIGIPWVIVINGYSVLPLQTAWAILLKEFIASVNETNGRELSDSQVDKLIDSTIDNVKKVFPKTDRRDIEADLKEIVATLTTISEGREPKEEIGYLTLAKYAKHMQAPHRMDLLISSMENNKAWNCNQKCIHCYAANEKMSAVKEMTTEQWKKAIDVLRKNCIPAITFTGGEPTIREDLVELVEYSKWFVTRLNTNGILLTKELCDKLYEASLDSVQVTFYSANPQIHNLLVGGDHFEQTVNGIKNAIEAGLDVSVNTPLCSINTNYAETIRFLQNLGVHYFSCSGLIPSGNALEDESKSTKLSEKEMENILSLAYEEVLKGNAELSFTSPGWVSEDFLKKKRMVVPSCGAGLSNMAIAPDGTVLPCQSWLFEDGLGNINTDSWTKIWNSEKCKNIRDFSISKTGVCQLREVKK